MSRSRLIAFATTSFTACIVVVAVVAITWYIGRGDPGDDEAGPGSGRRRRNNAERRPVDPLLANPSRVPGNNTHGRNTNDHEQQPIPPLGTSPGRTEHEMENMHQSVGESSSRRDYTTNTGLRNRRTHENSPDGGDLMARPTNPTGHESERISNSQLHFPLASSQEGHCTSRNSVQCSKSNDVDPKQAYPSPESTPSLRPMRLPSEPFSDIPSRTERSPSEAKHSPNSSNERLSQGTGNKGKSISNVEAIAQASTETNFVSSRASYFPCLAPEANPWLTEAKHDSSQLQSHPLTVSETHLSPSSTRDASSIDAYKVSSDTRKDTAPSIEPDFASSSSAIFPTWPKSKTPVTTDESKVLKSPTEQLQMSIPKPSSSDMLKALDPSAELPIPTLSVDSESTGSVRDDSNLPLQPSDRAIVGSTAFDDSELLKSSTEEWKSLELESRADESGVLSTFPFSLQPSKILESSQVGETATSSVSTEHSESRRPESEPDVDESNVSNIHPPTHPSTFESSIIVQSLSQEILSLPTSPFSDSESYSLLNEDEDTRSESSRSSSDFGSVSDSDLELDSDSDLDSDRDEAEDSTFFASTLLDTRPLDDYGDDGDDDDRRTIIIPVTSRSSPSPSFHSEGTSEFSILEDPDLFLSDSSSDWESDGGAAAIQDDNNNPSSDESWRELEVDLDLDSDLNDSPMRRQSLSPDLSPRFNLVSPFD